MLVKNECYIRNVGEKLQKKLLPLSQEWVCECMRLCECVCLGEGVWVWVWIWVFVVANGTCSMRSNLWRTTHAGWHSQAIDVRPFYAHSGTNIAGIV